MKRVYSMILAVATIASACEPIVNDIPMGGVIDEKDLVLSVTNINGGNKILLENNTPGVAGLWDYGIGKSILSRTEIVLPFAGNIDISFTGICDGGTVTTTRTVNVEKITEKIPDEWYLFANGTAEGKEWTWNDKNPDGWCYGTGSYGWETAPDWDKWFIDNQPEVGKISMDDYFKFDLDGGANFTSVIGGKTTKGTFVFDMSKSIEGYSIGVLELYGASVPLAVDGYEGGEEPVFFKFDIISLTKDNMVLAAALPGNIFQDDNWESYATYWNFKAKTK